MKTVRNSVVKQILHALSFDSKKHSGIYEVAISIPTITPALIDEKSATQKNIDLIVKKETRTEAECERYSGKTLHFTVLQEDEVEELNMHGVCSLTLIFRQFKSAILAFP